MPYTRPRSLMPHPRLKRKEGPIDWRAAGSALAGFFLVGFALLSLPKVLEHELTVARAEPPKPAFPITVDPINETIIEDPEVEALLETTHGEGDLSAAAGFAGSAIAWIANAIGSVPGYSQIAGSDIVFVSIRPGYRQEEAARAFGTALGWTKKEQDSFIAQIKETDPQLLEGEIVPGVYMVSSAASASYVQELLGDRFERDIVARYDGEEILPLDDVLTIASMLQRETRDPAEMRLISGIIWNRLWLGMNLQIDATLQYAKASKGGTKSWWPVPVPADKYIKSPYNTYQNKGLPPGPIASPSTEAVLAALNPKKTDCYFYFHDKRGEMHCSPTYEGHVALLKKYYGRGR